MQRQFFNKQFADQFRLEKITYPGFVEEQNQHLVYRQFKGIDNEMSMIGKAVLQALSDEAAIEAIMAHLEQKNIPGTFKLSRVVQNVYRVLYSYGQEEAYEDRYFMEVMDELQSYFLLLGSFKDKMENFLSQLNGYARANCNIDERELLCLEMEEMKDELDIVVDDVRCCYNYFYDRFDRELNRGRNLALTTPVELYILQIITYSESVIQSLEHLDILWSKWQTHAYNIESQEIYN